MVILSIFISVLFQAEFGFAVNHFPRYPVIDNNVRFWETIYGKYSTSQAVIHDSNNLGIVYEVIPILSHKVPGASKINKPFYKAIKGKYKRILIQLSKGIRPQSTDAKRVAKLFGNVSHKRLQKAADSIRVQVGQKDRFLEGVIRSGAYMARIKRIMRNQGIPEDLAYLPHVESSFNLKAYSKFGASGIWQFTRPTGKQFLTINYAIDERQDPILASHAAAKFLKSNYKRLESWPLALTAYNYGPAGMMRAKKALLTYERIFSGYKQGHFKFASRNFYPEFLAAKRVAKKLEKHPAIKQHKPRQTHRLSLPGYIATSDALKYFDISSDALARLNPALRRSVLQGKKRIPKGYTLHLPATSKHKTLLSNVPKHLFHAQQRPTQFYRVKKGDSAGKIARTHRVSLKALRKANNLDKNATVMIGQNLRIPNTAAEKIKIVSSKRKVTSPTTKSNSSQSNSENVPLLSGTKKNKPTWKTIQSARTTVLGELGVDNVIKRDGISQSTIIIQPEESLELLADWLEVPSSHLRSLNNFSQSHRLHPDQKIKIPLNHVSTKIFEEKRFDFHLETEEDFFNAYKVVGVSSYKVQKGDTIWEICKNKFDIPLWLLKKYNTSLDFSRLRSSQKLTIPIVKSL